MGDSGWEGAPPPLIATRTEAWLATINLVLLVVFAVVGLLALVDVLTGSTAVAVCLFGIVFLSWSLSFALAQRRAQRSDYFPGFFATFLGGTEAPRRAKFFRTLLAGPRYLRASGGLFPPRGTEAPPPEQFHERHRG